MAIRYSKINPHWNYFVALERDFEVVSRYVEPCEQNEETFSIELGRLLMAATQEVDVVLQLLCKKLAPIENPSSIGAYHAVVDRELPDFKNDIVRLPRFGMESRLWVNWGQDSPPFWWTANNKIKHSRSTHFDRATLKNTYNAISGLLLAITYMHRAALTPDAKLPNDWWRVTTPLDPPSTMFRMAAERYMAVGGIGRKQYESQP